MRSLYFIALLGLVLLSGGGCCHRPGTGTTCMLPGGTLQVQDTLFFGTNRPNGERVTPQEWQAFLDEVVTPRFPDGLTVFDAAGQWHDSHRTVVKEATKVLLLIHPLAPDCTQKIDAIITEYKRRFQQDSVLVVREAVSARF